MITADPTRLGLVTPIAEDETPFCGTHHAWPDDIAGYAVVLTAFGHGKICDLAYFDAPSYGEAVEAARQARADPSNDYARIDVLYKDGCRGIL